MNRSIAREVARDPAFEVTVAAPSLFRDELRTVTIEPEPAGSNLRIRAIPAFSTSRIHFFGYHPFALRDVLGNGYDLVHAWEEPYIFAGWQIARSLANREVPFCFRTAQSYNKRYPFPFSLFERQTLDRADRWIAGASLVRDAMLARGYPEKKGATLTLAVDTRRFRPLDPGQRRAVLDRIGMKGPLVVFLGRLTRAKGIPLLMEAFERLPRAQAWSLLLIGRGEEESRLAKWIRRNRFAGRVRILLASHRDVPDYLGAADVLVAPSQTTPSWREQFGRMIIEAFACGVPVIGSDSGEIPRVIGDAGVVLPESDVGMWSRVLSALLDDPERRAAMARRGLERVRMYSVSALAASYREFYRSLALARR